MWQFITSNLPGELYVTNLLIASLAISVLGLWIAWQVRERRPLLRHRLLCCVMLVLLVSPLLLWGASTLHFAAVSVANHKTGQSPATAKPATIGSPIETAIAPLDIKRDRADRGYRAAAAWRATRRSALSLATADWLPVVSRLVACVWLVGALLVARRWLRGALVCHRLRRSARPVYDARVLAIAARACNAVQLDHRVDVGISRLAPGPLSLGVLRPMIVLPQDMAEALGDEELLCILTHEAAHVARHDMAIAWLQQLCLCLYWWNPLVRVVHGGINRVREQICDDYVVRAQGSGDVFATVLVKLAEWSLDQPHRVRPAGVVLLYECDDLTQRITRLAKGGISMNDRFTHTSLAVLAVASTSMLAFAFVPALRAENPEHRSRTNTPRLGASNTGQAGTASFQFTPTALQTKRAAPMRLSYNDGSADGKKSIAGAAELLSFTLPDKGAKVAAVRIHGSRYGYPQPPKEDFEILFLNQDLTEVTATKMAPYSRFKRGPESWVEIKFPQPIEVPAEFWVGVNFRAERTKGVYVSYDNSTDGSHSRVGLPGQEIRDADVGGDWMIEVVLAK